MEEKLAINPGAQCSLPILFLRRLKFHRLDGHHLDGGSRLRRHEITVEIRW